MTTDTDAVLAVIAQERQAIEAGDSELYFAALSDDAVFMPPNTAQKAGAELRAWLGEFVAGFRVEWLTFVSSEVILSLDMAYHAFTYSWRVTPRTGGEATSSSGKGVHLLRRQQNGSWQIVREIWNSNPPSA